MADYGWNDLVLPAATHEQLNEVVAAARHAPAMRTQWGLDRHIRAGLAVLFSGPSGTGKTMAAHVVAAELGVALLEIDLARLVSKYIGETEKKLEAAFANAETNGAILLFDEADALFGKRSEVKDSHDRYANAELAYLLQRMESYPGLVILASSRRQAIDQAFMRRLTAVVTFPLPDRVCRHQLWTRALGSLPPGEAAHLDASALATEHALSGREIVNALRDARIDAAQRAKTLDMADIRSAIVRLRG